MAWPLKACPALTILQFALSNESYLRGRPSILSMGGQPCEHWDGVNISCALMCTRHACLQRVLICRSSSFYHNHPSIASLQ